MAIYHKVHLVEMHHAKKYSGKEFTCDEKYDTTGTLPKYIYFHSRKKMNEKEGKNSVKRKIKKNNSNNEFPNIEILLHVCVCIQLCCMSSI